MEMENRLLKLSEQVAFERSKGKSKSGAFGQDSEDLSPHPSGGGSSGPFGDLSARPGKLFRGESLF